MDPHVVEKILEVQDVARQDGMYMGLVAEYEILGKRFLDVLPTLEMGQRDVVMDLMGLVFEMHLRMLQIACSMEGRRC